MPRTLALRLALGFAAFALLLAGCGGPDLKSLNLENTLVQEGDLPAGLVAGQVTDGSVGGGAAARGFVSRIARTIEPNGGVTVILYDDDAAMQRDFKELLPGLTADGTPTNQVGTQAVSNHLALLGMEAGHVLFIRCHALVHVQIAASELEAMNYAKRLDGRLQPLVC